VDAEVPGEHQSLFAQPRAARRRFSEGELSMKPLDINEASVVAKVSVIDISRAMLAGELDWKRFRGQPVTTQLWLQDWKRSRQ
jgi:hypothetical protein